MQKKEKEERRAIGGRGRSLQVEGEGGGRGGGDESKGGGVGGRRGRSPSLLAFVPPRTPTGNFLLGRRRGKIAGVRCAILFTCKRPSRYVLTSLQNPKCFSL